jgi:antitoxin HicB
MSKNLKYYLNLNYPVEIKKIPKADGGGYLASIPQLGGKAFCGDGDNIEEALRNLNKVKEHLFRGYLEEGIPIPEPEPEPESIFSGKFVVRIPASLHRELVETARKENMSLNQLVLHLLSYRTPLTVLERKIENCFAEVRMTLSIIDFRFNQPVDNWSIPKGSYPKVA